MGSAWHKRVITSGTDFIVSYHPPIVSFRHWQALGYLGNWLLSEKTLNAGRERSWLSVDCSPGYRFRVFDGNLPRDRGDPLSGPPYNLGPDRLLCITIAGRASTFIDHSHNQRIHLETPCDVCASSPSLVTRSAAARWCK